MTATTPVPHTDTMEAERKTRNAVRGAFAGFFVDMFDVYLPIVVLAPAAVYFQATGTSPGTAGLISALVFVAALLGRPVGAFIFGHFGDRTGRKRTAMVAVGGFGVMTLAIALLPGYKQIGMMAIVALIALRFLDGIFLGGEYTAASPLAMEYSPKEKRGLYSALIMAGFPVAYVAISLLTLLMLNIAPANGLGSPYVEWGWRIPFVIGALMAFAFVLFYAKYVPESDMWEDSQSSSAPLRESPVRQLFRGANLRNFMQVFLMMSGLWITLFMVSAVLPGLLKSEVGLSAMQATTTVLIANFVLILGYVGAGILSQRAGRRPFFIAFGIVAAVLGSACYAWLVNLSAANFGLVIVLAVVINLIVVSCWGVVVAYITERFHTGVRASGFGLGYSLAIILPSFYAFYQTWLGALMPARYTPLALLVIGGMLMAIGAAMGPETRDVDLRDAA